MTLKRGLPTGTVWTHVTLERALSCMGAYMAFHFSIPIEPSTTVHAIITASSGWTVWALLTRGDNLLRVILFASKTRHLRKIKPSLTLAAGRSHAQVASCSLITRIQREYFASLDDLYSEIINVRARDQGGRISNWNAKTNHYFTKTPVSYILTTLFIINKYFLKW